MKPRIREVIVVEGRYDKNAVSQVVEAKIIAVDGFCIFSDRQKRNLLRRLACQCGLIVLTDGDSAGFLIRNHLKNALAGTPVKHAYIPDRFGKEPRKEMQSKEGKLGVEGMPPAVLLASLRLAGATFEDEGDRAAPRTAWLTKADMMRDGLSGTRDSAAKRKRLMEQLDLPTRLTTNALLDILNALYNLDEYKRLITTL